MNTDVFWLHAGVLLVALIVGYFMQVRIVRTRACFNLYRVRDRFVLLVAKDLLPQDSKVFVHYYGRINRLLQDAPNIGLDDVLAKAFYHFRPEEFDQMLEIARRQADKMAADPLFQDPEVRAAVADYYAALRITMLAHSSMLRVAYLLSRWIVGHAKERCAAHFIPPEVNRALQAVTYADREAEEFLRAA
jgi:hypothetical protein